VVADFHHFTAKKKNDPDPHQSERWDPDPHQSEKVDPDLHQGEAVGNTALSTHLTSVFSFPLS
jgi:hypothetical protein